MTILQVLSIFLCCGTLAQALYEGDPCTTPNGINGRCTSLNECPSVRQQILDNIPFIMCTKSPVSVCCPRRARRIQSLYVNGNKKPTMIEGPTHSWSLPKWNEKSAVIEAPRRGAIARQKCAEYSEYVYSVKYAYASYRKQKIRHNECATRGGIKLIVKGTKAEPKEFPHMAAIGYDLEDGTIGWNCGGSIISEKFVLTAAHCTWSIDWGNATWVRVGDLNLERSDDRASPVNIRVADRIDHPDYRAPALYHDIALLRLETAINFNGWTRPACLHTEPTIRTPKAVATGWGNIGFFDKSQYDLQKVTLPIVDIERCKKQWELTSNTVKVPDGIKDEWSICAGGDGGDTCQGDSGGPLVVSSRNKYCMYDIVGVTSLGQFCGFNVPGIYTRVYHYIPWIESVVWGRD